MLVVPVAALPNQTLNVALGGQSVTLHLFQRRTGLFLDLYVNNALVLGGMIARDRTMFVRDAYWDFVGDLAFFDTEGTSDPTYDGLGGRYLLAYLEAADL